jgi:hypothetical protein
MPENFIVIPEPPALFGGGIRNPLPLLSAKRHWIPVSIAGGADDGPGMTIWVSWRAPAPNRG